MLLYKQVNRYICPINFQIMNAINRTNFRIFILFNFLFVVSNIQNCAAAFPMYSETKWTVISSERIGAYDNGKIEIPSNPLIKKKDKGVWGIVSVITGTASIGLISLLYWLEISGPTSILFLLISIGLLSITGIITGIIGKRKGRKHRELAEYGLISGLVPPSLVILILLLIFGVPLLSFAISLL